MSDGTEVILADGMEVMDRTVVLLDGWNRSLFEFVPCDSLART